jgi:hypothetical protein
MLMSCSSLTEESWAVVQMKPNLPLAKASSVEMLAMSVQPTSYSK